MGKKLSKLDKNIYEIGYFAKGEPSTEFKENNKNKLLKKTFQALLIIPNF